MADTYEIVRFYQCGNTPPKVIRRGLTLDEAQVHCANPETSSKTATDPDLTHGAWFDGYDKENS